MWEDENVAGALVGILKNYESLTEILYIIKWNSTVDITKFRNRGVAISKYNPVSPSPTRRFTVWLMPVANVISAVSAREVAQQ